MTALDDQISTQGVATPPARLVADRVSLGYGERVVVSELSVRVPDDRVTVIVGPNACGKSTLLRGMARLLRPTVVRSCSTARRSTSGPPATWRAPSACCPRTRSRPRGSRSSTWSAAAATRTRVRSGAGPGRTSPPSPRPWS